ncbi:hypothetical protein PROFUN_08728 [Planoprotostelium fungivorum]|uniref:non-specific serine/threonine protein kinase n=1 Tax=Planoprotostelium fungivorum TaxID=1890364 RepID=A0A2P6ND30_9EUKA|nr:hypothetical protein PROFUN_08728 [Planoprotostelium fungivorum]
MHWYDQSSLAHETLSIYRLSFKVSKKEVGDQVVHSTPSERKFAEGGPYQNPGPNTTHRSRSSSRPQLIFDGYRDRKTTPHSLTSTDCARRSRKEDNIMPDSRVADRYEIGRLIGKGAYGKVKEIYDVKAKKLYAVKILTPSKLRNIPGGEGSILREISIMRGIDHKNCIGFIDYWTEDSAKKKCYLVLEYVGGGSLQDLLNTKMTLPTYQVRKLFSELIRALKHIHTQGIVHRDVKPDNIMLTDKGHLKLSDFGIADFFSGQEDEENPRKRCHGSPAFQAPEVTAGHPPDPSGDVWSAGVVLYQMAFKKYPFIVDTKGSVKTMMDGLCRCQFSIPPETEPELANLMKGIFIADPKKRMTLKQIKAHPWMKMKMKKEKFVATPTGSPKIGVSMRCSQQLTQARG